MTLGVLNLLPRNSSSFNFDPLTGKPEVTKQRMSWSLSWIIPCITLWFRPSRFLAHWIRLPLRIHWRPTRRHFRCGFISRPQRLNGLLTTPLGYWAAWQLLGEPRCAAVGKSFGWCSEQVQCHGLHFYVWWVGFLSVVIKLFQSYWLSIMQHSHRVLRTRTRLQRKCWSCKFLRLLCWFSWLIFAL